MPLRVKKTCRDKNPEPVLIQSEPADAASPYAERSRIELSRTSGEMLRGGCGRPIR
jgi:hypothetical protein